MAASSSMASILASSPSVAFDKSSLSGSPVSGLPSLRLTPPSRRPLTVVASGGKKISVKQPNGPSGDAKFRGGKDASGSKAKGKGVYQFTKKYGANVDGYSPIYAPEEWSSSGEVYAGGATGLAIWAVTLGAILLGGALLVYNTSALAQ